MTDIARIKALGHHNFRIRVLHEHKDLLKEHLNEDRYSHFTRSTDAGVDFYFAYRDGLSEIIAHCFDGLDIKPAVESLRSAESED